MARTEGQWQKGLSLITPSENVPILLRNSYLNFGGDIIGDTGYGFRDNAGVMEVKNSGGVWTVFGSGVGYTNLTQFVAQTPWRVFYSDSLGDVNELALGANGTFLKSNGAGVAPSFATPAGSGDVVGPASAVNDRVVFFDGVTGKLIKDSGLTLAGNNTGDQTSIAGITGTKAQFDTAVTDGNFMYVGDAPTAHTHILTGVTDITMTVANLNSLDDGVNTTLHFHDADRARANHTGSQLASTISDFASTVLATVLTGISFVTGTAVVATDSILVAIGKLQKQNTDQDTAIALNTAKVTNATHTGDATGATALTLATVNANVGAFTNANITVNAKGLITAAANGSGGGNTFNTIYIDQSGGTSDTHGVLAGTINGSNAVFTVSQAAYATGTLKVYLNGQLLTQGTGEDWTETTPASGTFTFITDPAAGSLISVEYQRQTTNGGTLQYARQVANIAVNTTAGATTNTDYVYFCTATLTLTLPTAVGNTNRYTVKCVAGTLTIDGAGAETIDGTATISVAVEDSVDLISNGTEWKVV